MQKSSIKALPTEVLYKVFQQISGDEAEGHKMSIKNIRMVSRRFKAISSAFLIKSVTARMTSQSLSHLEEVCRHPDFRKSISQVTIDTSYYDRNMAADRRKYAVDCGSRLSQYGEIEERTAAAGATSRGDEFQDSHFEFASSLYDLSNQIEVIDAPDFEISAATETQKYFFRVHEGYAKLSKDQEEVRLSNNHIRQLCACLSNLPALQKLVFSDKSWRVPGFRVAPLNGHKAPDHDRMLDLCMSRSGWNGSFHTAYTTEPPLEMLGELLSQLGKAAVRPQEIEIDHNTPVDFRNLQVDEEQTAGIRDLVSQTSIMTIKFSSLDRKGSLGDHNDRSHEEMIAIGSLFKSLTSTTSLKSLKVGFDRYPVFYQFPTADLSDLLPIRTMTWPNLNHIVFNYLPYNIDDLAVFILSHRNSIRSFTGTSLYLRNGSWSQALDILRGFDALEHVELVYPQG